VVLVVVQSQEFFSTVAICQRFLLRHHKRDVMRLATHAVEVDEVEVGRHAEQYVSWDLDTNLAERGVFWRLPVYVLGHEEQATDLTVYR